MEIYKKKKQQELLFSNIYGSDLHKIQTQKFLHLLRTFIFR
jgi:hypothetical protein